MIRPPLKAITFDCAMTLVDVAWTPARSVENCAERLGVELPSGAARDFAELFRAAAADYAAASAKRTPDALHDFWVDLHAQWLPRNGLPPTLANAFVATGETLTYCADSVWFTAYSDVAGCMQRLREDGIRLAVLSNWDSSLHRILGYLGLRDYFDVVVASLEEGMEKPDPALFHLTLDRLGVGAEDAVHVGDNPIDDLAGARNAGMRAILIDRVGRYPDLKRISTLDRLDEAIEAGARAWSE